LTYIKSLRKVINVAKRAKQPREEVWDPGELGLVLKAFGSRLSNCVMWRDARTMRRVEAEVLGETGLRATAVLQLTLNHVRGGGSVYQIEEKRAEYRVQHRYWYKILLEIDGEVKPLFVEAILHDDDPEYPVVSSGQRPFLMTEPIPMKPFPWKCPECAEKAIEPVCEPIYETVMRHDGRDYPVAVKKLDIWKCRSCGLVQLPESAEEQLQALLRKKAGLMPPELIRRTRERLKLSQKQLAEELQVAESTLSRWESGMQIQQRAMDQYLRLVFTLKLNGEFEQYQANAKKLNPRTSTVTKHPIRARANVPSTS
jgi:putative zinc finger/helix-turn-helix YgiT family protein